jgi:hypothetical protein
VVAKRCRRICRPTDFPRCNKAWHVYGVLSLVTHHVSRICKSYKTAGLRKGERIETGRGRRAKRADLYLAGDFQGVPVNYPGNGSSVTGNREGNDQDDIKEREEQPRAKGENEPSHTLEKYRSAGRTETAACVNLYRTTYCHGYICGLIFRTRKPVCS